MSASAALVVERLADADAIAKARIHPIGVLAALLTYGQGHGMRGSGEWTVNPQVVDALDAAFYPLRQRQADRKATMLALDVSGSMGSGTVAGTPGLTPRVASAAMALVTAAVEPR